MNEALIWIIIVTLINGLLAFAGALVYFIFKKNINKILIVLVSFTTGALLGGAFFHFLPEAIKGLSIIQTTSITVAGFVTFLLIERLLHWHHCHKGNCEEHKFTYLLLYGDGLHNFIDGLIIAGSFLISIPFGIVTSILILAHELPQEIGNFGVLLYGGLPFQRALLFNFLSQLTAVIGGLIGYFFLGAQNYTIYLLPFAAGSFIYIALADLVPEIFREKNLFNVIVNLLAIIVGLFILISAKLFVG